MIESLLIGAGGIVAMMVLWMVVQRLWGQTFSEHMIDDDALAGRTKCSNCGCTNMCENKPQNKAADSLNNQEIKSYGTFSRL